jgi:UDP-N-acetyl-D-glucosamine dehydrogenase
MKKGLLEKIQNRSAQVAVVGLGYVGLPLALRFSECGFRVIGIDTDAERVGSSRAVKRISHAMGTPE